MSSTFTDTSEENLEGDNMASYEPTLLEDQNANATSNDDDDDDDDDTHIPAERNSDNFTDIIEEKVAGDVKPTIEPEQDVVSFIEQVLQEDVRSWVPETDSFSAIFGNKTRGGHTDLSNMSKISRESEENDEVLEVNTTASVVAESNNISVIITKDGNQSIDEAAEGDEEEEVEEKVKIAIDRASLERAGDKATDAVISVVTWNLAEESPSEDDAAFIRKFRKNGVIDGTGSDLVLISGQECENIKPRRSEGRRSREFRRLMVKMLGLNYVPIAMHLLGGIQFGLFCKKSFLGRIQDVAVADVTCGIGNVFHNKGAIAAFVTVKARNDIDEGQRRSKQLRMVFVTAHLAAHVKNAEARDSDFWRISSELEAQAPEGFLPPKTKASRDDSFLFDSVDRVFFCGDLNYRLDLPRELAEYTVLHFKEEDPLSLIRHDQLIHSIAEGRAFPGFSEGKIAFQPTFKFDKDSEGYDSSHKQRIPAWTDRILFKPGGVRVLEYDSVPHAQHSDHRPVFGTFRVSMEGRPLPAVTQKKKSTRTKRRPSKRTDQ
jgi:hypothetical protein